MTHTQLRGPPSLAEGVEGVEDLPFWSFRPRAHTQKFRGSSCFSDITAPLACFLSGRSEGAFLRASLRTSCTGSLGRKRETFYLAQTEVKCFLRVRGPWLRASIAPSSFRPISTRQESLTPRQIRWFLFFSACPPVRRCCGTRVGAAVQRKRHVFPQTGLPVRGSYSF